MLRVPSILLLVLRERLTTPRITPLSTIQGLDKLAASPMDKFMSGLADMMSGPQLDGGIDIDQEQEVQEEPQDMNAFRESLIKQSRCNTSSSCVVLSINPHNLGVFFVSSMHFGAVIVHIVCLSMRVYAGVDCVPPPTRFAMSVCDKRWWVVNFCCGRYARSVQFLSRCAVLCNNHPCSGSFLTGITRFQEGQLEEERGFYGLRHVRLDNGQV